MKCDQLRKSRIVFSTEGSLSGVDWFKNVYNAEDVDEYVAELKDEIETLKKEVLRQKRLRCYNLKMWCSAERFTRRSRTAPDERHWWERHFYSVCRIWERFKEAK